MQIIDIHSHLQFPDFDINREEVLQSMRNANVATIVVGTNISTSQSAIDLANKYPNVVIGATVGHHPNDDSEFNVTTCCDILDSALSNVVAIGECGLDYYRSDRDEVVEGQSEIFRQQIELAIDKNLPLVLHGRPTNKTMNAYEDMIDILTEYKDEWGIANPGNVHFFVGSVEIARQFLDLGYTLSFDGPITFARDYDEVIRYIPSDMIHAETDSPYAAPLPHRGQVNNPTYVKHVVDAMVEIRNESDPDSFKFQLVNNAKRVFSL